MLITQTTSIDVSSAFAVYQNVNLIKILAEAGADISIKKRQGDYGNGFSCHLQGRQMQGSFGWFIAGMEVISS